MSRDASTGGSVVQNIPRFRVAAPNVQKGRRGYVATTSVVGWANSPTSYPSTFALQKRYITLNVFSFLLGGWIVPGSVLVHLLHLNAVITG